MRDVARLANFALIETHKIRSLGAKPTGEYLFTTQFARKGVGERIKFGLQLILAAENIGVGEYTRRRGVTDMDRLIRLALAAKLCAVHLEAGAIADHF